MANNIITEIFKAPTFKVIEEETGLQVWAKLGIIAVDVLPDAAVAENPLSITQYVSQDIFDETTRRDSRTGKIIHPTKIQVRAICDDPETISSVIQFFGDEVATFTVHSKDIVAESMCVVDVDIDQSPQRTSAMMLKITMKQTEERVTSSFDPERPEDAPTFGVRIERMSGSSLDTAVGGLAARAQGLAGSFASGAQTLYNKVRTFTGL